jgi:hypothetical protein
LVDGAAASMEGLAMTLGDLVVGDGKMGLVVDIDPEARNTLLVACVHEVRVGRDPVEVVECASFLRRFIMQAEALFLRCRDCGWRSCGK